MESHYDYDYNPKEPTSYNDNDNDNDHDHSPVFLFVLFMIIFARIWWEVHWAQWNNNNNNNLNHILLNNETIIKNEIKFSNELNNCECTICLEDFKENEKLYKLTCNHYYHKGCIDSWLSNNHTCPLCRLNLI